MDQAGPKNTGAATCWARLSPVWVFPLMILAAGSLLAPLFWQGLNSDGVSYLTIARAYANGRFSEAINAYWAPLYSWLLVPGWLAGAPMPAFAWGLNLGIAALGAGVWQMMLRQIGLSRPWQGVAGLSSLPLWGLFAFESIAPDGLLVTLMALSHLFLLRWLQDPRMGDALGWGLFGGIAYLAKAYYFPFFCLQWLGTWAIAVYFSKNKPLRTRHALLAGLSFILLAGPWVGLISIKNQGFILSGAAAYNQVKYDAPGSAGHLMETLGLQPPRSRYATSIWEDITPFLPPPPPPLALTERAKEWAVNMGKEMRIFHHKHPAFGVVLLLLLIRLLKPPDWRDPLLHLFAGAAVFAAGYAAILVMDRYLWWIPLLTTAGCASFAQLYSQVLDLRQKALLAVFLVSMAWVMPVYQMRAATGQGLAHQAWAKDWPHRIGPEAGPVASDSHYYESLFVCFRLGLPYHGQLQHAGYSETAALYALRSQGVRWFLVWEADSFLTCRFAPAGRLAAGGPLVIDLSKPLPEEGALP